MLSFVHSADEDFGNDSDHEQVTEDAHLHAEHTHEDHHSSEGSDNHNHDHNHDGKHDHEDHHLGMNEHRLTEIDVCAVHM